MIIVKELMEIWPNEVCDTEPGIVELENRKLGMLGISSISELSSSVWRFSALKVGQTPLALGVVGSSVGSGESWGLPSCWGFFFVVVCTLFILDPGLLGPGIWVPGIGQPSSALVAFIFYFVVLFVYRLVGC